VDVPQEGAHPGLELEQVKWLGQVITSGQVQAACLVRSRGASAEDQDRDVEFLEDAAQPPPCLTSPAG
jgi:hypothetical protein